MNTHPAYKHLMRAVRFEQRLQFVASAGLLGLGLTIGITCFSQSVLMSIIGLTILVTGIRLVFLTGRQLRLGNYKLERLLNEQPRQIVWVYAIVTERMPFGLTFFRRGTLYFKLIDGDELSVSIPARQLKLISKFLNRVLPHATFGYSAAKAQSYDISPDLLLREES